MDAWDTYLLILLGFAGLMGLAYLVKLAKAKRLLAAARDAEEAGDDAHALYLYKGALRKANEDPRLESTILEAVVTLYTRNQIPFDAADYRELMDQYRALAKRSSNKSMGELVQVQTLKDEIIDAMPTVA